MSQYSLDSSSSSDRRIISKFLLGVFLFFGSFLLHWFNEAEYIAEKNALSEMEKQWIGIDATAPSSVHDGKLVHATAMLDTKDTVGDGLFLKAGPYLAVQRKVEMFQWVEHESIREINDSYETIYSYTVKWAENRVASENFNQPLGHENPPAPPFSSERFDVKTSSFGQFSGASIVERLTPEVELVLNDAEYDAASAKAAKKHVIHEGKVFLRKDFETFADQVGDVRVSYQVLEPATYSVMAVQSRPVLKDFEAKDGRKKFVVRAGAFNGISLIALERAEAADLVMMLRAFGFFAMWIGMCLLCLPVINQLGYIPFLRFIHSFTAFIASFIFFIISAVLSVTTILLSMIFHQPITLYVALGLAVVVGIYLWRRNRNGSEADLSESESAGALAAMKSDTLKKSRKKKAKSAGTEAA